ncbi:MAG: DUF4115 domain-containing protein [Lamprobacter sp.]|uniref:RodZ domain-containing protein n=1 Tax=Lamprobacter sp. TaxID=3100796 RepID=UPI002B25726F|nr:RodZ domain-containing protein [Lamprobacter sp.]MEA3638922.1 DUF4115 domain-containing protein [Lamprobacter sp.]
MTTAEETEALPSTTPARIGVPSASATDSPGQQLRQAREARKLDISQLATSLRVTPQVVDAIERDDYAQLPSAVFVSGYIRSYARLVGLDPEPLKQSFHRLHPNAEPPLAHVARTESSKSSGEAPEGSGLAPYLITGLILLALAAGGYGWWVSRPEPDLDGGRLPAQPSIGDILRDEPTETPAIGADPSADRTSQTARQGDRPGQAQTPSPDILVMGQGEQRPGLSARTDEALQDPTAEPSLSAGDDRTGDPSTAASPDDRATERPANTALPTPASPEEESPRVTQTASLSADSRTVETQAEIGTQAEAEAEAEADPATADSASPSVELAFRGPCWVDIRDSTGKVLLFGEMSRDDRERLSGTPPYSLVLGNAAAVELTVAGQPFDLSSIARGNVARFQLDPAEVIRQAGDASAGSEANAGPDPATEANN